MLGLLVSIVFFVLTFFEKEYSAAYLVLLKLSIFPLFPVVFLPVLWPRTFSDAFQFLWPSVVTRGIPRPLIWIAVLLWFHCAFWFLVPFENGDDGNVDFPYDHRNLAAFSIMVFFWFFSFSFADVQSDSDP